MFPEERSGEGGVQLQPNDCPVYVPRFGDGVTKLTCGTGPDGSITLHRADMLKVLTDNLPSSHMFHSYFNKRLVSYTSKGNSVLLHFADGSSAEADILVGADGIRSAIRSTMYTGLANRTKVGEDQKLQLKSHVHASWSGTYAYRSLVEAEKIQNVFPGHQAASTPMMVRSFYASTTSTSTDK